MLNKLFFICLVSVSLLSTLNARTRAESSNAAQKEEKVENLRYNKTIRTFMAQDKRIKNLVYNAYVYIAFPSIGKGGLIFGGAYGEGRAYRRGMWIGDVTMSQYTVGLQVGGQSYSEIIFFKTEHAFNSFKKSGLISGTQASLIGGTSGVSGNFDLTSDTLVFTSGNGGLMLEASTGAQNFTYVSREH